MVAQNRDEWRQLWQNQYSNRDFIVIRVIDISGGLKIWLDIDVTVSDPDVQQGPTLLGLVKALVQPSFRWL